MTRPARLLTGLAMVVAACTSPDPAGPTASVGSAPETTVVVSTTFAPSTSDAPAWIELTPMATPRSEAAAAVIGGLIYVPGGLGGSGAFFSAHSTVEVYDPAADEWAFAADMPERRHHLMVAAYGGLLFVFGGLDDDWEPTDSVWSYDPETDEWTIHHPMPKAIGSGAAVSLGDSIYILGGIPGGRNALRYEPGTDSWEELSEMSDQREHVGAATLDDLIYVVGGRWRGVGERATVEVYQPDLGEWAFGPDLLETRGGHGVTATGSQLVALGGERLALQQAVRSVEVLAAGDDGWVPAPQLPTGLHGIPVAAIGDTVYVLGGSRAAAAVVNDGGTYSWRS